MKALTVRDVDEKVYERLRALAKANGRSLQSQVRMILEREVQLAMASDVESGRQWRERLADREWGDIVADVRHERER